MDRTLQKGDKITVEQAWEDEEGYYHDEIAEVLSVENGLLDLRFPTEDITVWLKGAEFREEDYRGCRIAAEGETDNE